MTKADLELKEILRKYVKEDKYPTTNTVINWMGDNSEGYKISEWECGGIYFEPKGGYYGEEFKLDITKEIIDFSNKEKTDLVIFLKSVLNLQDYE